MTAPRSTRLRDGHWSPRYSGERDNPLHDFYIPALAASITYDRKAGFFSSTALAVAAQGIGRLIANGGRMRLLVGCVLSREDVVAIRKGYEIRDLVAARLDERFRKPIDLIQQKRLEALAWMVANGTLEIKVALPREENGDPVGGEEAEGIFHEKAGVFRDAAGDRLAFNGSINESAQAWLKNRESFHVFRSWGAEAAHVEIEVEEFETLWSGRARRTLVLEFPEALRQRLIALAPPQPPPPEDPAETREIKPEELEALCEQWLFQFVRDAPHLKNGRHLATALATVRLWPHQDKVVQETFEKYPERFLLADEVGLGKTIEAGAVIKQLLLTGIVRRCLILVPGGLVRQWQEELGEKFNLHVPAYNGSEFQDAAGQSLPVLTANPWNSYPVILASAHLAKRQERANRLLEAEPWDLLVIDEAHHARRGAPTGGEYRPNRLLRLLSRLKDRTTGLLMLTATPMQLAPVELWDLLVLLGMGGLWGSRDGLHFERFFAELKAPEDKEDREFLARMVNDHLENGGNADEVLQRRGEQELGVVGWRRIEELARQPQRLTGSRALSEKEAAYLHEYFRRHTPLRRHVFRNTRDILRHYQAMGLLRENIPGRRVDDRFIPFENPQERELYERIEQYIREVYQRAEQENDKGLGFIMTVYRRRLTSSLYAIRRSLERRLDFLLGGGREDTRAGLTEEEVNEEDDLREDVSEDLDHTEKEPREAIEGEAGYLRDFIEDLKAAPPDSKLTRLTTDLQDYLEKHPTVLIFTQYADTMDYLRDRLVETYGRQVASYSGRGGEYWDGSSWRPTSKENIKTRFATREDLKILVCTEAASEGLNLQTCSLLINYDMPWNPMRVEQRIGRIDRIGQEAEIVEILNYFYEDTIEAEIHRRLGFRIEWFRHVVGRLQPILAALPEEFRQAAFASPADRQAKINEIVRRLEDEIDRLEREALNIEEYLRPEDAVGTEARERPPLTPDDLERLFVNSSLLRDVAPLTPADEGTYWLDLDAQRHRVTFRPDVYDAHPQTVRYLAYGDPLFEQLLTWVPIPAQATSTFPLRRLLAEQRGIQKVAYYWLTPPTQGSNMEVATLAQLQALLESLSPEESLQQPEIPPQPLVERDSLEHDLEGDVKRLTEAQKRTLRARSTALKDNARALLDRLLAIQFARDASPDDQAPTEPLDMELLLRRNLERREIPFPALVQVVAIRPGDAYHVSPEVVRQFWGRTREALNAFLGRAREEVRELLCDYREIVGRLEQP